MSRLKTCFVLALRFLCNDGTSSRINRSTSALPARWKEVRKRQGLFWPRNRKLPLSNSATYSLKSDQLFSTAASSDAAVALERGNVASPEMPMSVVHEIFSVSLFQVPRTSATCDIVVSGGNKCRTASHVEGFLVCGSTGRTLARH